MPTITTESKETFNKAFNYLQLVNGNEASLQTVLAQILMELSRAIQKHPHFPEDLIHMAAIVAEESGELIRATVQQVYEGGSMEEVRTEAVQTAATAIRFLLTLKA